MATAKSDSVSRLDSETVKVCLAKVREACEGEAISGQAELIVGRITVSLLDLLKK